MTKLQHKLMLCRFFFFFWIKNLLKKHVSQLVLLYSSSNQKTQHNLSVSIWMAFSLMSSPVLLNSGFPGTTWRNPTKSVLYQYVNCPKSPAIPIVINLFEIKIFCAADKSYSLPGKSVSVRGLLSKFERTVLRTIKRFFNMW